MPYEKASIDYRQLPPSYEQPLPDFNNFTPETVRAGADSRLDAARGLMTAMLEAAADPEFAPTYDNTLGTLDKVRDTIGWEGEAGREEMLMAAVHPDEAIRDAAAEAQAMLQSYWRDVHFNEDAYGAVKAFAETDAVRALSEEQKRFLENTLREFRLAGQELGPEDKETLRSLRTQLDKKATEFLSNLKGEKKLSLTPEELDGLPETFVSSLPQDDDGQVPGTRIINANMAAHVNQMLAHATNRNLRKKVYVEFNSVGTSENERLLQEMADLRLQVANLLGYPSWAHMQTEDQMAGSPDAVEAFVGEIAGPLQEKVASEIAEMQKLLRADGYEGPLQAYDIEYYTAKIRQSFDVDDKVIAEYLPIDSVLEGMFDITGETFGVTYEEIEDAPTWHEDVRAYQIKDTETGEVVGSFYLDLFPREGKRGGGATYALEYGHKLDSGEYQQPVTVVVANLTPPTGDRPSLLQPGELIVPFHEIGHVLHISLARTETVRYAGDNIQQDCREAPSQMTEKWPAIPGILKLLGRHHRTGEPIPAELIENLSKVQSFGTGIDKMVKLRDAIFDAGMHGPSGSEGIAAARQRAEALSGVPHVAGVNQGARLRHMAYESYAGRYYSYIWADVYAEDILQAFRAPNTDPKEVGGRSRQMLKLGGSLPARKALKVALGREPNQRAFVASLKH